MKYDNLPEGHIERAKAVILNAVMEAEKLNGNTFIPFNTYLEYVQKNAKKYRVNKNLLSKAEDALCESNDLIYMDDGVSRKNIYDVESDCAKELYRIVKNYSPNLNINIDEEITKSEQKLRCSLHINQREAVKQALLNGVLLITGGPGTGKQQ